MAVRKITMKGTPVLHQPTRDVTPQELASKEFQTLVADMVETMYAAKGVGIAATQVGENLRVFIAESAKGPIALINPYFTDKSKKTVPDEEGCLSIPGKYDKVRRHREVTIQALTLTGEKISFKAENFFARILQHEMDHLDGLLYVDRVAEQKAAKDKKK